jgi:PST family polysaccharide transporter
MKQQLAKGVLWLSAAKLVINILSLSSTFVLARILIPEDFGLVAIAITMMEILAAFTELSLAASLIHHAKPTEQHYHTAWTMNLIRATAIGTLFSLSAPFVASAYGDTRLETVMYWIGLSVFLSGLRNPKIVTLTRQMIFKQEFTVAVTERLVGVTVSITLAIVFRNYWALIAGMLATQTSGVITSYLVVRYRPRVSLLHARELLSFSVWLSLGQIINTLNWRLDHLLIGGRLGSRALGLYTVGDKLASLPTREAFGPIEQALFPGLRMVADDPERLKAVYRRTQALITALALPLGILFALQAALLVRMVLGEKWHGAELVVQYLASVMALQTMASPVQPLALAKGETRLLFYRDLLVFLLRVPILVTAAFFGGLALILQARTLTGVLSIGINMLMVRKILKITVLCQLRNNERSLFSAGIMAVCFLWIVPEQIWRSSYLDGIAQVIWASTFGLLVYGLTHTLAWWLQGKPLGAETEFFLLVKKIQNRLILLDKK